MNFFKQEDGLVLPLVLMIMVIVALLFTTLWTYSRSDLQQAVWSENNSRAYYVARSGAESMAQYLMRNPESIKDILNQEAGVETVLSEQITVESEYKGEIGDLQVEVKSTELNRIQITGMATVNDVYEQVSVVLAPHDSFDGVIYSLGSMTFQNNVSIQGDIASGGTINLPSGHSGNYEENKLMSFPLPDFFDEPEIYADYLEVGHSEDKKVAPEKEKKYEKTNIGNHGLLTIKSDPLVSEDEDDYFESRLLDMHNNGKLHVELQNGETVKMVVDELVLKEMEISGEGRLELYVRSKANIQTKHAENMIVGDNAVFVIYLDEGCVMEMQANSHLTALVYGPEATVEIGGNADFSGSMIVGQLKGSGGTYTIGSAGTDIKHKFSWDDIDIQYGGYWIVHWLE